MSVTLPDPSAAARQEVERLAMSPDELANSTLRRVLTDCPFIDRASLLAGLTAFHAERMAKLPSAAKYPEAQPWIAQILAVDREIRALTGMSDEQMALYRSLRAYLTFRGYACAQPAGDEKCRIAYIPDTDQGALHIKNVDDPLTYWKPETTMRVPLPVDGSLVWDGVGSGLHIDDEPEEIFPLPVREMCLASCDDVPGAVDFLTRYQSFWASANVLLRDRQGRSVAIEKTSHNYIGVYDPGPDGRSHISGMSCRDPHSAQAQYVKAKRTQYLRQFDQPDDGPDQLFWNAAAQLEQKLSAFLNKPGQITAAEAVAFFTTPWPEGLNKCGLKLHPDQGLVGYTLQTRLFLLDQRQFHRWQRSQDGADFPATPEVVEF